MVDEMSIFENEEFGKVSAITVDGEPHFNLDDISFALGYTRITKGKKYLRRDRIKKVIDNGSIATVIHRGQSYIDEDGLYEFIFESRTESARGFRKWVTSDILPKLRRMAQALETVTYTPSDSSLVNMRDGFCYTTTNKIAELFNEEHRNVIAIIDRYLKETEEDVLETKQKCAVDFMKQHVKETTYLDSYNRPQRSYELDEYAFSMVALSFTGKEAEQFKIAFIEQFFNMRQALLDRTKALAIEQVLPQKNNLRQYVYLIKNEGTKNIKIGVGQNPEQRLKQLQTGTDADLTLIYKSMICSNAFEIETYMHKEFQEYNVRNEWFNCNEDILIEELERCEYVLESDFNI